MYSMAPDYIEAAAVTGSSVPYYAYAGANPIGEVDSTGLQGTLQWCAMSPANAAVCAGGTGDGAVSIPPSVATAGAAAAAAGAGAAAGSQGLLCRWFGIFCSKPPSKDDCDTKPKFKPKVVMLCPKNERMSNRFICYYDCPGFPKPWEVPNPTGTSAADCPPDISVVPP